MAESYSVWQLTTYIRDLFDLDPPLQDVWVEGEISNFTRASSGHLYFTLKDDKSELRSVMWKGQAAWLGFEPRNGDAVLAHGRVTVYEVRGVYQLVCDTIQTAGAGDLNRQFELLKAKLDAEGLFDSARKRAIPTTPRQIGIVTSPTTAAFQDIQNILRRRYPLVEVILSPALVQGIDAPPQIVAALQRLNDYTNVDVIILARGGGSLEDLWCFNHETVVRAVAASRIPVVTGVGHEIDFTLVDFAADLRAPTPSAAAEVVTPDMAALRNNVRVLAARLDNAIDGTLDADRRQIETQRRWLARLSPDRQVQNARQRIDDLTARMALHWRHQVQRRRDQLDGQRRALQAANPDAILQRGYAIVTRGDGQRVTSVAQAAEGSRVQITLRDGRLIADVRERRGSE
jgi:exodeoxyribonuclease VII large subunit